MSAKTEATKPNGRPAPHECPTPHRPGALCPTCGGTPPIGRGLADTPDVPYEERWSTWYRTYTASPDPATLLPAEQRAAIEAATRRYQEACAAHDRVVGDFIAAVRADRKAKGTWTSEGFVPGGPELIERARGAKDDTSIALLGAEEAMADRLHELNLVSLLPTQRRQAKRSIAESVRRMVFG